MPERAHARWAPDAVRDAIRLIAITDDLRDGVDGLVARATAAERGGATMVQVRFKALTSRELLRITRALVGALQIPVVVNDRLDIALAADAAGVHVGITDLPVRIARALAPEHFLIGASLTHAGELIECDDADYVGVGPLFGTPSKPDASPPTGVPGGVALARAAARPAVAIGGVDDSNTQDIVQAGFDGVSVIRAVLSQPDPEVAARTLRTAVERGVHARAGVSA
ncbi:MAG: thiamine phosphate synthase [Gemmatimonadaceae bacterium]|jgi:thiamine-phosphate pyrophosphorylase|nr:thiamine phosphate synthase [Gemmatimonadaceae bacterium]